MVTDRSVSLGCVVAYGLWAATVALLLVGTLFHGLTWQNWGLACSAGAATATVRQYFVRQNRMMRNAFELGRDAAVAATPLHPR